MTREEILAAQAYLKSRGIEMSVEELMRKMSGTDALLGQRPEGDIPLTGIDAEVAGLGQMPAETGYGQAPAGGTLETGGAGSTAGGAPGTWETAIMSVAKVAPSIIQAATQRKSYAPAANIGGRRVMDIPKAGDVYGDKEKGFQSLLAMFLRGR
jgi:hypothetical protein